MSEFKDCPRCGRNHRHLKYCGWDVGKLKDHTANLERKLEEALEIAENALDRWGDTDTYCSCTSEREEQYIKLEQLKEKGE